ncbi:hypothetical protein MMC12_007531 [Toensbergia leucococca]|nr:hypothetical protein [Toensbergia leucococca]
MPTARLPLSNSTNDLAPNPLRRKLSLRAQNPHIDSSESLPSAHSSIYEASPLTPSTTSLSALPTTPITRITTTTITTTASTNNYPNNPIHIPHPLPPIPERPSTTSLRHPTRQASHTYPSPLHTPSKPHPPLPLPSPIRPIAPFSPPPPRMPTPPGLPRFNTPAAANYRLLPPPTRARRSWSGGGRRAGCPPGW